MERVQEVSVFSSCGEWHPWESGTTDGASGTRLRNARAWAEIANSAAPNMDAART